MVNQTQLEKVRQLYSQLIETRFNFIGKGEFCLQKIYSIVREKYSYLCDDGDDKSIRDILMQAIALAEGDA